MRPLALLVAVGLAGCSIVHDPSRHQSGGGMDAGAGTDAGAGVDAGAGTDAGTDAGATPVQASEFCLAAAELQCFAYFNCCGTAPTRTEGLFADCVAEQSRACAENDISRLLVDPRTGYDARIAGEVLREGYGLAEACDGDGVLSWSVERSGVQRILTGTVESGDPCTPRDTSVATFDYPALFSCVGSDRACVPVAASDWSCLARRSEGQSCIIYFDCQDGMMCEWSPLGTCQPRRADGATCGSAVECQSLFCDAATGRCRAATQNDVFCNPLLPETTR
ncbi:MAG: hypothetical protein M5U28_30115 [Sandaracinaceae bacterium]|nr:hypothetical protein [Sandaracinaceae bacterium]